MIKKLCTFRNLHILGVLLILGVFAVAAIAYIQHGTAFIDLIVLEPRAIGKCFYRENFGISCPSCGLTRSFISIGKFNFSDAFGYNRIGPFIYLLFILALIFNVFGIFKSRYTRLMGKLVAVYGVAVCIILVISWVLDYFFGV